MRNSVFSLVGISITAFLFLLMFGSQALGDCIHDVDKLDSAFTLYGDALPFDATKTFVLTPTSILHMTRQGLDFAASVPAGWTRGLITFQLSFDNQVFSGRTTMFGSASACKAGDPCFFFGWAFPPGSITQKYPATLTLTYGGPNGATETSSFVVAPVPEPGTVVFFGTGVLLLCGQLLQKKNRACGLRIPGRAFQKI